MIEAISAVQENPFVGKAFDDRRQRKLFPPFRRHDVQVRRHDVQERRHDVQERKDLEYLRRLQSSYIGESLPNNLPLSKGICTNRAIHHETWWIARFVASPPQIPIFRPPISLSRFALTAKPSIHDHLQKQVGYQVGLNYPITVQTITLKKEGT
jgi:hypothetical protein